jgi:hypothetical protein
MPRLLACPRGHQWEVSDAAAAPLCPVCGDVSPGTTTVAAVPNQPTDTEHTSPVPVPEETCTVAPSSRATSAVPESVVVPGYEILRELGRGGMGVVYQARHLRLNRVVALKMIIGGACADRAELARFQSEAEAIARLDHPGIVQIHEIGEFQGLPFLSLEYCAGGSLDKLVRGTPLPAAEAARIVELIADAMHTAHGKQIVHRDLKPGNILLASALSGSWSMIREEAVDECVTTDHPARTKDYVPKVTDFGIAKKLDEKCGTTANGMILGTPSYMAPEQVTGTLTEIGPATDIYALGAILYELLTGRPPFKAATALDTTMQVMHDEPVPPSKLQSHTPRDLETISLKCLQKVPARRYGSAADLADDLRRFRGGEPIRARRTGMLERAGRWCRRHPLAPIALAVLLFTIAVWAGVRLERRQLQTVGRDTAPSIIAADDIKASLADMHRHATEQLLAGAGGDREAAAAYEQRRMQAAEAILDAAVNITYGESERAPLRQLIHMLGTYEQAVARSVTLREKGDGAYLDAYREADRIMQSGLLPAAAALHRANREVLERACAGQAASAGLAIAGMLLGAAVLLAVLGIALWRSEAIRWRAALVGSMALTVVLLTSAVIALWYAAASLHRGCGDAFDSIDVLQQARADAFAAHGVLGGALLDRSRAADHERAFAENAAQVAEHLAAALRNSTFAGEHDNLVETRERFAEFQEMAGRVRRLAADGKQSEAVVLGFGRGPGQANHAFTAFGTATVRTIGTNRRAFDRSVNRGFDTLATLEIGNALGALAVLALAYMAVRGRAR